MRREGRLASVEEESATKLISTVRLLRRSESSTVTGAGTGPR